MSKHDLHKSNDHYIQIINNWAYLWLQEVYKSLSHQSFIGFLLNIFPAERLGLHTVRLAGIGYMQSFWGSKWGRHADELRF